MNRVFIISNRKCTGPGGGSGGVCYKTYLANRKYNAIENVYYIFRDLVIEPTTDNVKFDSSHTSTQRNNLRRKYCKKIIDSEFFVGLRVIMRHYSGNRNLSRYFKELDEKYHFNREDIYVFHDVESAHEFIKLFHIQKSILVYHQQGSLYYEWKSFSGVQNKLYERHLNRYFLSTVRAVNKLAFPSNGAAECLFNTQYGVKAVIEGKSFSVLYNGYDAPETLQKPTKITERVIKWLNATEDIKFASVSALTEAKGVDRIPQYFSKIIDSIPNARLVIVGSGIKLDELKNNIKQFELDSNIMLVTEPLPHDDIIQIFSNVDFYLMMHRFSIFDYATIEAMSKGAIPILTPVGGNKEVIIDGAGIFVKDDQNAAEFMNIIENNNIKELKNKVKQNQYDNFGEKSFIYAYKKLIDTL